MRLRIYEVGEASAGVADVQRYGLAKVCLEMDRLKDGVCAELMPSRWPSSCDDVSSIPSCFRRVSARKYRGNLPITISGIRFSIFGGICDSLDRNRVDRDNYHYIIYIIITKMQNLPHKWTAHRPKNPYILPYYRL